jgi:predicted nuclease of predicted toxin-antitoxin system
MTMQALLLSLDVLIIVALSMGIPYAILVAIRGTLREQQIDNLVREELAEMQKLFDAERK